MNDANNGNSDEFSLILHIRARRGYEAHGRRTVLPILPKQALNPAHRISPDVWNENKEPENAHKKPLGCKSLGKKRDNGTLIETAAGTMYSKLRRLSL